MSSPMVWFTLTELLQNTSVDDVTRLLSQDQSQNRQLGHSVSSPPALRAMAYGDGFFTTIGVAANRPLWLPYHQTRIASHLQALYIYAAKDTLGTLWQMVIEFGVHIKHGIIKVLVSREVQSQRGYGHSTVLSDNPCQIWIGVQKTAPLSTQFAHFLALATLDAHYAKKVDTPLQAPIVAACLQSRLACMPEPLAGLKTLNRLDSVMIAGELERLRQTRPSLGEGLVRDMAGNWVEGVMSNVFYRLLSPQTSTLEKAHWFTPPLMSSGVHGVMRQVIIDRLALLGTPVQMRPLRDEDLERIETLFFCNAVRGVIPVGELIYNDQLLTLSLQPFALDDVSI